MKKLLLSALLLTAPAASAQTTPVPALPPGAPASTPAAGTAATTTLRLTAQPGTTVEWTATIQTQITLEELQVTGPGGQAASAAELAQMRADIQQGMNAGATPTSAKMFFKVQGRAADGTVTLLTTVVTAVPGADALSIRIVQTVAPNGQTRTVRVESDNPDVQRVLQALPPEVLRAQVNAGGGDFASLYGQTFTVGQPRTQTTTVDAQALLGSIFGAVAGDLGAGNPFANLKASPLTVRTTTTYRGTNASGQRVFDMSGSADNWTVELGDLPGLVGAQAGTMQMRLELLDLTQSGQSLYRQDGLPAGQRLTQTMRMRLTMTQSNGMRMQMTLRLNQNMQAR